MGFLFVLVFHCLHVNTERTVSSGRTRLAGNEGGCLLRGAVSYL